VLLDDDMMNPPKTKRSSTATAMVVTQSALNGLARYACRYLQLMNVMKDVSQDVFVGLQQLFDYYLCEVFLEFVSTEDRQRCLSRPVKSVHSPAPVQQKDFEASGAIGGDHRWVDISSG